MQRDCAQGDEDTFWDLKLVGSRSMLGLFDLTASFYPSKNGFKL